MFRVVQMSWTASHSSIATPNWWPNWCGDKWVKKSWNCRHKALFTNWYRISPAIINRMFLKGLAEAKSLAMSKTSAMDFEIWPISTREYTWKSCGKLLVESWKSKKSHKCSKTISKGPPVEWCNDWMKIELKKSKENSKSESSWKYSKEFWQGEDKCERWNT